MTLNKNQIKTFKEATIPLIKWLNENCHPHTSVTVDGSTAELFEGVCRIKVDENVDDTEAGDDKSNKLAYRIKKIEEEKERIQSLYDNQHQVIIKCNKTFDEMLEKIDGLEEQNKKLHEVLKSIVEAKCTDSELCPSLNRPTEFAIAESAKRELLRLTTIAYHAINPKKPS